ncbi:MAG: carbon-nitrogen hydrolase family protein [Sporomusaceae bacterium]|nr:carbon-nitrogen hydrolase family protein [Sporomusaceae bacterium]
MRIALLHLDLGAGPEEKNIALLTKALTMAAEAGATWIVTPETAMQGYFFSYQKAPASISVQPALNMEPLQTLAAQYQVVLFLCCAETDAKTGINYNSCLVIDEQGVVIGRHRKLHSHGQGAERWATKGTDLVAFPCGNITVGILICADSYFEANARLLQAQGAQAIVVPAAWPPGDCGGPPVIAWERCSAASGLPVWICNQTGRGEVMDMTKAESAVIDQGKLQFAYSGLAEAILLFEWDEMEQRLLSTEFEVIHFQGEKL